MDPTAQLAAHIRAARERAGLTQGALAERVGFNSSETVSQIELGKREVKAWELSRIARALHVEFHELLSASGPVYGAAPLWREGTARRGDAEGLLRLRTRRFRQIRDMIGWTASRRLPRIDDFDVGAADYGRVESLALRVGEALRLGAVPADVLFERLEDDCGVMVFYADLGSDGSAACVRDEVGAAMLLNSREAPWRRTFSAAHELFHLLTWSAVPRSELDTSSKLFDKGEKLANAFASALLLPEAVLLEHVARRVREGKLSPVDLAQMARHWGVSTAALLWRLVSLGRLSRDVPPQVLQDPSFREVDRATMHQHWWEPPELPRGYVEGAVEAYLRGLISRGRLATLLEQPIDGLSDFLSLYGLDMELLDVAYETAGPAA